MVHPVNLIRLNKKVSFLTFTSVVSTVSTVTMFAVYTNMTNSILEKMGESLTKQDEPDNNWIPFAWWASQQLPKSEIKGIKAPIETEKQKDENKQRVIEDKVISICPLPKDPNNLTWEEGNCLYNRYQQIDEDDNRKEKTNDELIKLIRNKQ